ncbi:MAG: hypothetical protein ABJF04_06090 [Reichenbachiella sp.]|uniref:hypothetical protein n=1 Tax=Reichenbachiella sp. TaxID=2184521 RepID=UPI003266D192
MKKILVVVTSLTVAGIFYYATVSFSDRNFQKFRKTRQCEFTNQIKQKNIEGTLIRAFRDKKNHFDETIEFVYQGDTIRSNMFILEQTSVFNKLKPGDFILKESGYLNFNRFRNGEKKVFKLDYGCNNESDGVRI